jgi:HSP20 family molecular chaperone IbpA
VAKGGEFVTTMLKWSPFEDLDSVERRMRPMFEEVGFAPTLLPAADIYETEDEFVVEVEVPGYEETELGIEVSDHRLTTKGERKERAISTTSSSFLLARKGKQSDHTAVFEHRVGQPEPRTPCRLHVLQADSSGTSRAKPVSRNA